MTLMAMSEQTTQKMMNMFNTAHAIGKKGRSFTDFEWICDYEMGFLPLALATDGAAVMIGARTGVVSQLKGDQAYIISIHCMAYMMYERDIQSVDAQNVRGVKQAKARKYYSTAREAVVIRFCGFLNDTLTHLSSLSASLQRSTITIAEAHSSLCSTQAVLKKYKTREGPMLKGAMANSYEGISLTSRESDRKTLITWWITSKPVLETSAIHVEKIPDQWTILKVLMCQEPQSLQQMSWVSVNRSHQHSCPDLLALVDLVLSFPASMAECERGFNTMKQVKTNWRSSLLSDTLSDLLMVQLSSPEIKEYDPTKAVILWHQDSGLQTSWTVQRG
ncbi:zinc finger protein 862-like [Epinephelus fuscoguttatus]|uniref:zinc finger protein 862-like n=1 Tax=Epinephelus fuscoguttatus TaxID=293821 RepID=UPI0020D0C63E|nr:zinc finger protein 862-like [Epinephelus fuscoguttatus]